MYSARQYRSDLRRVWQPVRKSAAAFGKKFRTLDPSKYAWPCLVMCTWLVLFMYAAAFLSLRRLISKYF